MQEVFVFNEIAVIIRHWYEIGVNGREHGARVEIRLRRRRRGGGTKALHS